MLRPCCRSKANKREPMSRSNTSKCFTTAVVVILRSALLLRNSFFETGSRFNRARMRLHNSGPLEGEKPSKLTSFPAEATLDMPTHTFELLNESGNFPEHALLFGEILRIKRAHLRQNGIEFSTIVTGKFPF